MFNWVRTYGKMGEPDGWTCTWGVLHLRAWGYGDRPERDGEWTVCQASTGLLLLHHGDQVKGSDLNDTKRRAQAAAMNLLIK